MVRIDSLKGGKFLSEWGTYDDRVSDINAVHAVEDPGVWQLPECNQAEGRE